MESLKIILLITTVALLLSSQAQSQGQPESPIQNVVAGFLSSDLHCPPEVATNYSVCVETAKQTLKSDEAVEANNDVKLHCSLHNEEINCLNNAMSLCTSQKARVAQGWLKEYLKVENAKLYNCTAFELRKTLPPAAGGRTCDDNAESLVCLNFASYKVGDTVNMAEKAQHCINMNETIDCFNALKDNCKKDVSQDRKNALVNITRTAYASFECVVPATLRRSSGQEPLGSGTSGKEPDPKMTKSAAESGMTTTPVAELTTSSSDLIKCSGTTIILALGSALLFLRPLLFSYVGFE